MTVNYSQEVSTASLGTFAKLLLRWRGSIYKLLWKELAIFAALYYFLALVYRVILPAGYYKTQFENLSKYCRHFTDLIPITFVLGFYVTNVVNRFWTNFFNIPWIDKVAVQVVSYVHGNDERGRLIRRSLVRYANALFILIMKQISRKVKKRFPTSEHLVAAGVLTEAEQEEFDRHPCPLPKWWLPDTWFANLAVQARREGRITDDILLKSLVDEILNFRQKCADMWCHDWVSVPLVYTQVVTIAVYSFVAACLVGRQHLATDAASYFIDEYIPLFTLMQLFFYIGWLKVAEELINPLGEDEDDYDLHFVIDRNITVGYLICDWNYGVCPRLEHDMYWDERSPDVPYTMAAESGREKQFVGSADDVDVKPADMEWTDAETVPVPDEPQASSPANNLVRRLMSRQEFSSATLAAAREQAKTSVRRRRPSILPKIDMAALGHLAVPSTPQMPRNTSSNTLVPKISVDTPNSTPKVNVNGIPHSFDNIRERLYGGYVPFNRQASEPGDKEAKSKLSLHSMIGSITNGSMAQTNLGFEDETTAAAVPRLNRFLSESSDTTSDGGSMIIITTPEVMQDATVHVESQSAEQTTQTAKQRSVSDASRTLVHLETLTEENEHDNSSTDTLDVESTIETDQAGRPKKTSDFEAEV